MPSPPWLDPLLVRALPLVVTGLAATWRVSIAGQEQLGPEDGTPDDRRRLFAIWHGRQLCLVPAIPLARRRAPIVVMVSASRDGQIQAPVLHQLGLQTVVGSSSRRGGSGLLAMARAVDEGASGLLAVDGPAGPVHCAKSGLVALSRLTGVPMVPVGARIDRFWTVPGTWDGFRIPTPTAHVQIVFGRPVPPPGLGRASQAAALDELQRRMAALNATEPASLRRSS